LFKNRKGKITKRKRVLGGVVAVIVVVVVAVLVTVFLVTRPSPPPTPLFTVTGKEQPTEGGNGTYEVTSWNFTFAYRGTRTLQNVDLYLNNGSLPFKMVPEITKGWTYEYIWTPPDISASVTITISWQGGTENYEFQP
jgi:hypothetical protein